MEQCLALFRALAGFMAECHARGERLPSWPAGIHCQGSVPDVFHVQADRAHDDRASRIAYTAPEHLLGVERPWDESADLHALGVTFYRALVGCFPFDADCPELVHAQLGVEATPPHRRRSEVPRALSALVSKLLAKSPRDRYATAASLRADLDACARAHESGGEWHGQDLGALDASRRVDTIPVVGREEELKVALSSFRATGQHGVRALFVAGAPGVGKTTLVDAFRSRLGDECRVALGKFDQVHRGIASSAVVEALRGMVQDLLSEDPAEVEATRLDCVAAVGRTAGALVELVPDFAALLGSSNERRAAPTEEAKNRLERAFVQCLSAIASRKPLLLVLDDLHWSDAVATNLLRALFHLPVQAPLLVVGLYRDNELDPVHPFRTLLDELRRRDRDRIDELELTPLSDDPLSDILRHTLGAKIERLPTLVALLRDKTGGNPLFFQRLLRHALDAGLFAFEEQTRTWTYDEMAIRTLDVAENLVDFIAERCRALPEDERRLCQIAACLGDRFTSAELRLVGPAELDQPAALEIVRKLERRGIVTTVDAARETFRFQHDRIRQAMYETLLPDERAALHLDIARRLASGWDAEELEREIFRVAGHFNDGKSKISSPHDHARRREINLRAAAKALQASAYTSASAHAQQAFEDLPSGVWQSDPVNALRLHRVRASAEYLAGDLAAAERTIRTALGEVRGEVERADLHALLVTVLTVAARYDEALASATGALHELGIALPEGESAWRRIDAGAIPSLVRAAAMRVPRDLGAARILATMLPLTFIGAPRQFPSVVAGSVQLALDAGPTAPSAIAVAAFGILLASEGRYREADAAGRAGIALSTRFEDLSQRCKAGEIHVAHLAHWVAPLRALESQADAAYEAGIDGGELQYAGYTRLYDAINRFYAGRELGALRAFCKTYLDFARSTSNKLTEDVLEGALLVIDDLLDDDTARIDGDAGFLERCEKAGSQLAVAMYLVMKAELLYRKGRARDALEALDRAKPLLPAFPGIITGAAHVFVHALSVTALAEGADDRERADLVRSAKEDLETLHRWSEACPENFHHKALLVRAELLRLEGESLEALRTYEAAISAAHAARFVQDELLANSRLRDLSSRLGLVRQAKALERDERELRGVWGVARSPVPSPLSPKTELDLEAALRAAQAISDRLRLDDLLRVIATTAMTHTGADRCVVVLLERNGTHRVAATAPDRDADVPSKLVRHVLRKRAASHVVCGQSPTEYELDPYLRRVRPASALCVPLQHQGTVEGALYLESRVNPDVFSMGTRALLDVLCSQAAISLAHAQLFEKLEVSLDENKILFRELQHRVKNNLQVVASLLSLQLSRVTEETAKAYLETCRRRVRSIQLVHEQLDSTSRISRFAPRHLRSLALEIARVFDAPIDLRLDLSDTLVLDVSQAVPLSLLLSELLTNAYQHAFPNGATGEVLVALRSSGDDELVLTVSDTGVGMGSGRPAGLGLGIAGALAQQLGGELELHTDRGLRARVAFPWKREGTAAG